MSEIPLELIEQHILTKLDTEIPEYLTYHRLSHTLDVRKQALIIAHAEGIDQSEDLLLLEIAALYHDTGFLNTYKNHEAESCRIAKAELLGFGLSPTQLEIVTELIRATKVPQEPHSPLAHILCDADLDYLGRSDYYEIAQKLYAEFLHIGIVSDEVSWTNLQISFLESHKYFTAYSKTHRAPQKAIYLTQLKARL